MGVLLVLAGGVCRGVEWKDVEGTRIPLPPGEHPRLYLRGEETGRLKARLEHPALQGLVEKISKQTRSSKQAKVEWDAVQYLATQDRALGRATIKTALELVKKCELPDRQDACRATGRMMVTGAIVYDWCYALLTAEEKQAFVKEFVRLAKTQETGYPPVRQGAMTGHGSEAQVQRDMISAGIAIYDEFPEMYQHAAVRLFRDHFPARNWLYEGHAYHQGDSYGAHRFSWDTFPLFIFDRMGAGNVYNAQQRFVPYYWMYTTRPDGQRLRAGDTFAHSAKRGEAWSEYMGTLLVASYYKDPVLMGHHISQTGLRTGDDLFAFLWQDVELAGKGKEELPLSRYFGSPYGWMVARTGWGQDAVVAQMKVNEYNFANHQHLDAGEFQIYYKGALATDSGVYSGSSGQYGSPHCFNYYWRTIAHNCLLVHDPAEQFGGKYGNDGGQRLPNGRSEPKDLKMLADPQRGYRTGKVLARGFGPDVRSPEYTLLTGDLTAAYSGKVTKVERSFVFLNLLNKEVPGAMVVLDRVVSTKPEFRKTWLLHSLEEPMIRGRIATVECTWHGGQGRLVLDALLPGGENLEMTKVGGPGKEYWVNGTNWANDVPAEKVERGSVELAAWRVEISPKTAAKEDLFLNVMQVSDRRGGARWPVRLVETASHVGCVIEGAESNWMVLMGREGADAAKRVEMELPAGRPCAVLVTGLAAGKWRARGEPAVVREIEVSPESEAAWIRGGGGKWVVERMAE